ncbi:GrpB family protein [Sphingobium aquiterrae]|uniref:GrpB family protein n=1 Tax=Sphingobium aquiterrae TaxID=2038656 RepID=UPI003018DF01
MDAPDPRYGLGLAQGDVRVVPHNPLWARAFVEESTRIMAALGPVALAIEHYGSTAVPGLDAKPIIDMQIGVADLDDGLRFGPTFAALGYDLVTDHGIPDHHLYARGTIRTFFAHIALFESDEWFRTLRFRDRLRADPALRDAYRALKHDLAANAGSRRAYTDGKTDFVTLAGKA